MKPKSRQVKVLVTLDLPPGATIRRAVSYVQEAVQCHAGGLDAETDPWFYLDRHSVKTRVPRIRDVLVHSVGR